MSIASKKNFLAKKAQHVFYNSNHDGFYTGVESPTHLMIDPGLVLA